MSPSLRPGSQDRKGRLANLVTTPRRLARRSPSSQYLYTLVQGAHRPRHVAAALSPVIPFRKRGSLIVENYFGPGSIPCRITAPNDTNDSIAAQMDEEEPYHGSVAEGVIESSRRLAVGGGQVNALQRTPTTGLAGVDHQLGGGLNLRGRYSSVSEGVASAGHPPLSQRDASAERTPSVLVEDRMGEFNPVVGERWAGTLGENSLMGMGGEHSTGERQDLGRAAGWWFHVGDWGAASGARRGTAREVWGDDNGAECDARVQPSL